MAVAYILHYEQDDYRVRGVEVPFTLPILDPDTGKETGFTYSGIIDVILEKDGKIIPGDHKTVSRDSDGYWAELDTNPQVTQYLTALQQSGYDCEEFLWDVLFKPSISPVKLTKKAIAELESGTYCGLPFKGEYLGEEKETPLMYGMRVFQWYREKPDKQFKRQMIRRQPEDILRCFRNLKVDAEHGGILETAHTHAGIAAIPAYEENCKRFTSLCDYHKICARYDVDKAGYGPRKKPDDDSRATGSGSFSPSRRACLHRCPTEYVYRYVEKIEPLTKPYAEALEVGTMVHAALEIPLRDRLEDPIVLPNGARE